MQRRRATVVAYATLGLLVLAVLTAVLVAFGQPLRRALPRAVLYTAVFLVYQAVWQWMARATVAASRPTGDDERPASWRTYDGERPAKWRGGWLHRSGSGFVAIPVTGDTGPRVHPADVREVQERDGDPGVFRPGYLEPVRVLALTLADGARLDLLVAAGDAPAVRRWLERE